MSGLQDALVIGLVLLGVGFSMLAGIGILRMPDVYMRMHAATKAGTLGVACIVIGVAIHFQSLAVAVHALLIVAFFFLTAPVASHLIARAGFAASVPLWERTLREDMKANDGKAGSTRAPAPPGGSVAGGSSGEPDADRPSRP